jgi:hypothetical protein
MQPPFALIAGLGTASVALGACAPAVEVSEDRGAPVYQGVSTILLDEGLASFSVAMQDASGPAEVEAYGRCAAARYALDQGYGFARQVRTIVKKEGQIWYGDAVYLLSADLPEGLRIIDATAAVADCGRLGIPTV